MTLRIAQFIFVMVGSEELYYQYVQYCFLIMILAPVVVGVLLICSYYVSGTTYNSEER